MKVNTSIILFSILFFINTIFSQTNETVNDFGKLTVIVKGFESDEGKCRFGIDNSEEVFERDDSVWIGKVLPIENKKVIITIDSLKYGEYAVRIFHDKNENTVIDTNILGIPTEDFGYSNNASGWFGPPSWDKAKFIFNKPEMTINIDLD